MLEFRIGGAEREYLLVKVLKRQFPDLMDYWDGNWLEVEIEARIGAWSGRYFAYLRVEDFVSFRKEIEKLQAGLVSEARFDSMEEQLSLTLQRDRRGRLFVDGDARDMAAGYANSLLFKELDIDRDQLSRIVTQLTDIEDEFPLRGRPPA